MRDLRLSLVQTHTYWHDAAANRAMFSEHVLPLAGQTDLVVLTETMLSGFTRESRAQAESMDGESVAWLRQLAVECDAAITGSMVIKEGEQVFNRLLFVTADGDLHYYDKRHLFRMAGEHERYDAGKQRLVVTWRNWRICPMVCYDLRFPVWCRNRQDYDLLLFVANWPAPRRHAWRSLLVARAIENLAWVAAVNRIGSDGNGVEYSGDSLVVDPLGAIRVDLADRLETATFSLSAEALNAHRERFPAHMDADRFLIET